MYDNNENVVLCASNSYEKKYYFNPDFDKLPEDIKNVCFIHRRGWWNT